MNFTREPMIETVITPREGCKLVVRNSKVTGQEEYTVDAIEVVSFGQSLFFRCLERPKSFLVPVTDYEVLETKEARMVLKNAPTERSIKIGGGREHHPRPPREPSEEQPMDNASPQESRSQDPRSQDPRGPARSRDNKRRRGRRGRDRHDGPPTQESQEGYIAEPQSQEPISETGPTEEKKAPSFISKLFPPPTTLIKETLSRYKTVESVDENAPEKTDSFFESDDLPPQNDASDDSEE